MRLKEIYEALDTISPFQLQESWDNSGLILGDLHSKISRIIVSLDVEEELIEEAEEGTLFLVHHPLIFGKISQLDLGRYPANLLARMICKNQSMIALHTNFDKTHLNRSVFEKLLGIAPDREEPFLCEAQVDWTLKELEDRLREAFGLEILKMVAPREHLRSIALCTGSGASLMDKVQAECFLTGDIKYHDAMKAKSQGLMMVDIGHWESERFFAKILAQELKTLPLSVIIASSKNPFVVSKGANCKRPST